MSAHDMQKLVINRCTCADSSHIALKWEILWQENYSWLESKAQCKQDRQLYKSCSPVHSKSNYFKMLNVAATFTNLQLLISTKEIVPPKTILYMGIQSMHVTLCTVSLLNEQLFVLIRSL